MLLRFGVSNHLSIRDYQELSFVASPLKDRPEGLIDSEAVPHGSVLPAVVIYGPNASGKSNFVDAIGTMRSMVLGSQTRWEPDGDVPCRPFKLDPDAAGQPSRFDIDFVKDKVRYHYGFEASSKFFESEWLYAFPKSHRRTLFERERRKFRFGRSLKGQNNGIAALTRPNSLYLSAAAQNRHEQLSEVYGFFRSILAVRSISVPVVEAVMQMDREGGLDPRVISFLKRINTGVIAYRQTETERTEEQRAFLRDIVEIVKKRMGNIGDVEMEDEEKRVTFELAHGGRDGEHVYFELDRESAGTRRLLVVVGRAFQALDGGRPLCVDELDASLHTQASEEVLKLFCSQESNPKGAQLIATTHDTNLLKSSVLRRDEVWFTEKDSEGATHLYPLTDIKTRKDDDIRRGYLQGRYGAVPLTEVPLNP